MTSPLERRLHELCARNNWREVIDIGNQFTLDEKSKFLWAWPTLDCLDFLKSRMFENRIENVLSIGCGSGLLEWLIMQSTHLQVTGLELDNSWWKSPYSPKTFIDLKFGCDDIVTSDFLRHCVNEHRSGDSLALLFCYFNDRKAFKDYVRAYQGNTVIIIGPTQGSNIFTDPMPLNAQFETNEWHLVDSTKIGNSANCLAIYKRHKISIYQV